MVRSRNQTLRRFTFAVSGVVLVSLARCPATLAAELVGSARATSTPFSLNEANGGFDFETAQMQGTVRLDGKYHGVTGLIDKRTGKQVIDPRYSALNLFRLFSVNQGMGQPRTMERTTHVSSDWIEVKWPATDGHKGEITARYEVSSPNTIDLTVTVQVHGSYRGYELFLSSYFDKALRPHVYLKPQRRAGAEAEPELVLPTVNDVFRGTVLVFPRDVHAARRCLDGRWERNEWGAPTVQMCPARHYGHCLAFLTDAESPLGVVLMSHPRYCYAISTRYHADDDADRLTTYSAFDLSLFGNDLLPGDQRTVKVRLAVTELDDAWSQPLGLYRAFLSEEDLRLRESEKP